MNSLLCTISRVAENQWHAVENDLVVGRGHASRRLDGRTFLSIDTWRETVFDRLADAMLADQAAPLYTVVDETDHDLAASWQRAGFTIWRREREFVVPTGQFDTAPGVVITTPEEEPLRELDQALRRELDWQTMPAEVLPWQGGTTPTDPSKYTVAHRNNQYVGLLRLATYTRQPRIGLIAVRADERRTGIARALLSNMLTRLHLAGIETVAAEVNDTNAAALALFESFGAHRTGGNLELVHGKA
ncbi:GNAT family N-acetyltransferase [Kribbella sp. NBC_01505]|uniref:GNAT family N-acetyltransferase n=1 Tax=Kribbella sp. NBC_01505 TaxID=2903580 RepID=UPI0038690AD5